MVTVCDLTQHRQTEDKIRETAVEQREILRQRDAAARIERELATEQASRHRQTSVTVERVAAEQLREQQKISEDRLVQAEKLAAVGRLGRVHLARNQQPAGSSDEPAVPGAK